MSWVKRRGHTTPNPPTAAPPVQLYDPNQHAAQSVSVAIGAYCEFLMLIEVFGALARSATIVANV